MSFVTSPDLSPRGIPCAFCLPRHWCYWRVRASCAASRETLECFYPCLPVPLAPEGPLSLPNCDSPAIRQGYPLAFLCSPQPHCREVDFCPLEVERAAQKSSVCAHGREHRPPITLRGWHPWAQLPRKAHLNLRNKLPRALLLLWNLILGTLYSKIELSETGEKGEESKATKCKDPSLLYRAWFIRVFFPDHFPIAGSRQQGAEHLCCTNIPQLKINPTVDEHLGGFLFMNKEAVKIPVHVF